MLKHCCTYSSRYIGSLVSKMGLKYVLETGGIWALRRSSSWGHTGQQVMGRVPVSRRVVLLRPFSKGQSEFCKAAVACTACSAV